MLKGLNHVVCMMDDVLVVVKTRAEHDDRLEEVLAKLEEARLTLNKEKCEFGVKKAKFQGHHLSGTGIVWTRRRRKQSERCPLPKIGRA